MCKLSGVIILLLTAACATDPNYEEGRRLLQAGFEEEGLARLAQSARDNPEDRRMRFEWMRQRDLQVNRMLVQAETARVNGQLDDAASAYWRALQIDPANVRARAGFDSIGVERRHAAAVRDAGALLLRKDLAGAEEKLRAVLAENATHRDARNVLRQVLDANASRSIAQPVLRGATGKQVTLEFRDANLRSVFDVLARTTGINFVFDREVKSDLKTTIVVRNSPVEDVIRLILVTNQLERKVLNENTLLVYPNTPAKQKEYQELVVRSFYLANSDAKQVLNLLRSVVKTRDLFVDEKLNMLVMKDTPAAVRLAEKLIAAQDLPEPEVTLEVEVLEVGSSRLRELGARFPDRVLFQDPATVAVPAAGGAAATAAAALQRASGGLVGFVATPALILNMRQQDGDTNVLANPRIRVKNREKARVHIGDRVPVVTTTSAVNVGTSSSVNYLDVGLKLEVEPNIHLDGDVAIKVGLEVSNIVREVATTGGGLAYQIGTRNVATLLRLRDGETQVLAGLIQDDERTTANRLPLLGDLPLLGRLFSSHLENRTKSEIVLLITPRIVRSLNRPDHVIAQFYSGTEQAIGEPPLTIAPTRPGTLAASGGPVSTVAAGGSTGPAPRPSQPAPALAGKPPVKLPPAGVALNVPAQAAIGKEFTASVSLLVHPAAAEAQVELVYDPALLAVEGVEGSRGRAVVKLTRTGSGVAVSSIKFRVVGEAPAKTRLQLEKLVIRSAAGEELAVRPPPSAELGIVQ